MTDIIHDKADISILVRNRDIRFIVEGVDGFWKG